MPRNFVWVAVALPVLAIGIGIVRAELTFTRTREFMFEIAGYDPRDLLRGHYLQFRLQLDAATVREPCTADSCCLCLTEQPGSKTPRIERATCETARSCDAWLDQDLASRAFRFYIPDVRARELERKLLDAVQRKAAHARMSVDGKGVAHVRELYVDGEVITSAPP